MVAVMVKRTKRASIVEKRSTLRRGFTGGGCVSAEAGFYAYQ